MKYIRCHIVKAKPCTLGEWEQKTGKTWNEPDVPRTEEGYKCDYPDGYSGWCPKVEFEKVSRPIDGMTFGMAIEAMKRGKKVARRGWNGKGQFVTVGNQFTYVDCNGKQNAEHQTSGTAALIFHGTIGVQVGWLASQSDMLSEDWEVVA